MLGIVGQLCHPILVVIFAGILDFQQPRPLPHHLWLRDQERLHAVFVLPGLTQLLWVPPLAWLAARKGHTVSVRVLVGVAVVMAIVNAVYWPTWRDNG
jgi:hypothetical protein